VFSELELEWMAQSLFLDDDKSQQQVAKTVERRNKKQAGRVGQTGAEYKLQPEGSMNVIFCDGEAQGGRKSGAEKRRETVSGRRLVILVNSRNVNFGRRQWTRANWLNGVSLRAQVCQPSSLAEEQPSFEAVEWLFVLGGGASQSELEAIKSEWRVHGDLLLLDSLWDSYRNLTLKHLASLHWLIAREMVRDLESSTVLLKCDDDAFLEVGQWAALWRHFSGEKQSAGSAAPLQPRATHSAEQRALRSGEQAEDYLLCAQFPQDTPVQRQRGRKWRLSEQEWPFDTFPSYCSGLAYLASSLRLVRRLYLAARLIDCDWGLWRAAEATQQEAGLSFGAPNLVQSKPVGGGLQLQLKLRLRLSLSEQHANSRKQREAPLLWIDDVYVTGVLAASLRPRPKVRPVNERFCYSKKQWAHRKRLGVQPCLAAELSAEAGGLPVELRAATS